jgi:ATP-binding cassette, subfamily B, multidrug efflux pump
MPTDATPSAQDLRMSMQRRGGGRPGKIEKAKDARRAMTRLVLYLRPYAPSLALVVGFVLMYSALGLVGPYLMGAAIDTFIGGKDVPGLLRTAALMLAAYVVGNLFQVAANWIMARVSQLALKGLRKDLFSHLQTLSMSFFDTHAAGGLMSRLTNDIDAINQAVSQNVTALIASGLTMLGILVAMFALNHWLALASLIVVPIMLAFTRFVAKYTRKGFRDLQRHLGELNGIAEEAISGQKVIKAFRRDSSVIEAFRAKNREVFEAGVYANSYALLLMPLTAVLGNFFVIVVASLGGWFALRGLASVGMIAAFINYGQNFTSPLRQLANLYNSVQAALAGAERVFEVIDTPPEPADSPEAAEPPDARPIAAFHGDVSLRGVSFSYVPGSPVIRDFSLEVKAGQTIALVGPTGAGKTTIINLLTRFYEIDGGSILIDGSDIRGMRKADLRRNLGLVLQDTFLFADSVLENIRYGRLEASDEECVEAARIAEADHFIRQLPRGYGTDLSERAGNLSQGQRQLLSIARAVLADPAILILDEATSSVDTRTEARIQQALLRLMKGRTSFVIAHRLSTIRDADKVVVIDGGKIVEQGSHRELLDLHGFYHHLYLSQFKGNAI